MGCEFCKLGKAGKPGIDGKLFPEALRERLRDHTDADIAGHEAAFLSTVMHGLVPYVST